ncbi:MAG: ABC transporter ATP-binding protein [Pikeienuella sp.]|uniref:ABC transporter ATP-binding protein n=1 Tax=Pikeienuella sp. TaxID=2831957 RepID=UPI00391B69D8
MKDGGRADAVELRGVVKRYGAVTALKETSFAIRDNEFFTLLGPSGCGKTTLLRMIAGFEEASAGEIRLYGEDIAALPPNLRPVNTVFQQYALFPHMNVAENVAFGMRMKKVPKPEIERRVAEALALVKLGEFAARRPSQLSGGQQQRVALARALAPGPKVLLLDEPLSALDLKLRQAMRVELKEMQRKSGIAFVFVTHDQEEALTMSDRIAVMSAGEVRQIGGAQEIYEAPADRFVADFIGETNLLEVEVARAGPEGAAIRLAGAEFIAAPRAGVKAGEKTVASIRPERITLVAAAGGLTGVLERLVYLGTDWAATLRLDDGRAITARAQNAHGQKLSVSPGERATILIDEGAPRLLPR